jgi:ADP-ribose pyrophosphatase
MPDKVEITEKRDVFQQAIFRIEQARLRYEQYDGTMSDEVTRLSLERGDSVAAVIHHEDTDEIVLTEQFRYPTHRKGPGWLVELPAGTVEDSERPEDTLRRELAEETGYAVDEDDMHFISTFYASPGGTSERIHLYYVRVHNANKTRMGGGAAEEDEDIRPLRVSVADVARRLAEGDFADAKTIIGLQWVLLHREQLHAY